MNGRENKKIPRNSIIYEQPAGIYVHSCRPCRTHKISFTITNTFPTFAPDKSLCISLKYTFTMLYCLHISPLAFRA